MYICRISDPVCINALAYRTDEGDPYIKETRNQEIGAFLNDVMNLPNEDFKKKFIEKLVQLDEKTDGLYFNTYFIYTY